MKKNASLLPLQRRRLLACIAGTTLTLAAGASLAQADYPSRPITIIVAYAPGGQGDVFARLVGERLSLRLKQPVLVDNRPGATGALGTRLAAKAPPDGYTLLLGQTGEMAVNRSVVKALGYDPVKDFKPVALIGDGALVLTAPANAPFNTIQELVQAARAKPGSISYASSGAATPGHLAAAALAMGTKTSMVHIPYKGAGPAMTDLLGGHVQFFFSSASAVLGNIKSGKLKALAVSTSQRISALPQVPTVAETEIPDFRFSLWGGLFAPAGTPAAVIELLNREVNAVLAEPALKARLEADGTAVPPASPAQVADFFNKEIAKYEGLVKATGIQAE